MLPVLAANPEHTATQPWIALILTPKQTNYKSFFDGLHIRKRRVLAHAPRWGIPTDRTAWLRRRHPVTRRLRRAKRFAVPPALSQSSVCLGIRSRFLGHGVLCPSCFNKWMRSNRGTKAVTYPRTRWMQDRSRVCLQLVNERELNGFDPACHSIGHSPAGYRPRG